LGGWSTSTYCRFVRIVRNPSARTDRWFNAISGVFAASESNEIRPRLVVSVRVARSAELLMVVSSCSRMTANAKGAQGREPESRPRRLHLVFGDVGAVGVLGRRGPTP
jgi:hypothetical protein